MPIFKEDGQNRITGEMKVTAQATGKSALPKSSGGSSTSSTIIEGLTDTQARTKIASAIKIIEEENIAGRQATDNAYDSKGVKISKENITSDDKYLSDAEANKALDRVIAMVGDTDIGMEIFYEAWKTGEYQKWVG